MFTFAANTVLEEMYVLVPVTVRFAPENVALAPVNVRVVVLAIKLVPTERVAAFATPVE